MTNMGSAQVAQLSANVSYALEVWVPWGVTPGSQDFLSNITFSGSIFYYVTTSSRCQPSQFFISISLSFASEESTCENKSHFIFILSIFFYLILGYFTPEYMYPSCFKHPHCSTTMLPCLLLLHCNARTELVRRNKRLPRDQSPVCVSRWLQSAQHSDRGQIAEARLSEMLSLLAYLQERCGRCTDNQ